MSSKKYIKPIILFISYVFFFIIIFLVYMPPFAGKDLSPIIYGKGAIEMILICVIFWPIAAFLGGAIISYLVLPLYILIHKKIIGYDMLYGIEKVKESEKFTKYFQGFFPALMAINFSLIVASNEQIIPLVLNVENFIVISDPNIRSITIYIFTFLILLAPTIGISMALFAPVWFLMDAGIVYTNKNKIEKRDKEEPIEARTLGGWYNYLLKGYAGIGTIFSYYLLVLAFFRILVLPSIKLSPGRLIVPILDSMIFFPLMFLITITALPTVILLDLTKSFRINWTLKWANKLGIDIFVEISFKEVV